jgi:hypothetical protein
MQTYTALSGGQSEDQSGILQVFRDDEDVVDASAVEVVGDGMGD